MGKGPEKEDTSTLLYSHLMLPVRLPASQNSKEAFDAVENYLHLGMQLTG